jgi:hypothetical protein
MAVMVRETVEEKADWRVGEDADATTRISALSSKIFS